MLKLKLIIATFILLIFQAPAWSANIIDCANGGGTVCSDAGVGTASPTDWSFPTVQDECNSMCNSMAGSIQGQLSNVWVCTATSATFTGYTSDPHSGNSITHCDCDITCVKGVTPRQHHHLILPRDY